MKQIIKDAKNETNVRIHLVMLFLGVYGVLLIKKSNNNATNIPTMTALAPNRKAIKNPHGIVITIMFYIFKYSRSNFSTISASVVLTPVSACFLATGNFNSFTTSTDSLNIFFCETGLSTLSCLCGVPLFQRDQRHC